MSVVSYEKDGSTFWKVYVNLRSKIDPEIREQKVVVGLKSEFAAFSEEKKLLKELAAKVAKREGFGRAWRDVIDAWEERVRSDGFVPLSEVSLMDGVSALKRWTAEWLDKPASDISRADGRKVLDEVKAAGKARQTQQRLKCLIDTVFTFGIEHDLIRGVRETPVAGMMLEKQKAEKVPEILTLGEIRSLLVCARRLEHPWFPVWAMALLTGMRNGELYALTWNDVSFEKRSISVNKAYNTRKRKVQNKTKNGEWRTVPVSADLERLLVEIRASTGGCEHVLPRFSLWDKGEQAKVLRLFCKSVGISSVRFHALRACFATQLLTNGVAPARVMKVCGWKDLKTMQHYIRWSGIEEKGTTDSLKFFASDEEAVTLAADLFQSRPDSNGVQFPSEAREGDPSTRFQTLAKVG